MQLVPVAVSCPNTPANAKYLAMHVSGTAKSYVEVSGNMFRERRFLKVIGYITEELAAFANILDGIPDLDNDTEVRYLDM
jgi:hypothetical protein